MLKTTNIFKYKDYKAYLREFLGLESKRKAGAQARLALSLNCQPAYISQVLNGQAQLSLEQSDKACQHLGHSEDESLYFLNLVQLERAGTKSLKLIFQKELHKISERQLNLKERLEYKKTLSAEDQATYYSSWVYAAIHVLISIPGLETADGLSLRLKISTKRVREVLDFLTTRGLLEHTSQGYKIGVTSVHLGSDSAFVGMHHIHWRNRAIQSLETQKDKALHYSSVVTLSEEDVYKVRTLLTETIEKIRGVIRPSTDEVGYCYLMDLFEV